MSEVADDVPQPATSTTEHPGAYVAPPGRLITWPFVVVTTSALTFFMYIGLLLPLVPLYIEGPIGAGEFGVGLNAAVFAVAAVASRPTIGRLADRYGRRAVIVGGGVIAAIGGFGIGLADDLPTVLGFRVLTGIGEAAVFVGAATLVADLSPRNRRAEGASYFSIAVFTGLGVGPVVGEWLLDDVHFRRTFTVAAGFALATAAIALLAPSRVVSADPDPEPPPSAERTSWRRLVHPAALMPGLVLALGVGGLTTFFLFVPEYSRSLGMPSSGGLFFTYAAVSLVIRIFGAKLPDRLGPRRAVTLALVNFSVGLSIIALVPTIPALWVGAVFVGLGAAFNYPSLMALTVNRVSDRERAAAVSSFTMFFEIGAALSGLLVGALAQLVGKQPAFFGGVACCLVGLWLLRTRVAPGATPDLIVRNPDGVASS